MKTIWREYIDMIGIDDAHGAYDYVVVALGAVIFPVIFIPMCIVLGPFALAGLLMTKLRARMR